MGWFSGFKKPEKTFEQELILFVTRWTSSDIKGYDALTNEEIGRHLIRMGQEMLDIGKVKKTRPSDRKSTT